MQERRLPVPARPDDEEFALVLGRPPDAGELVRSVTQLAGRELAAVLERIPERGAPRSNLSSHALTVSYRSCSLHYAQCIMRHQVYNTAIRMSDIFSQPMTFPPPQSLKWPADRALLLVHRSRPPDAARGAHDPND